MAEKQTIRKQAAEKETTGKQSARKRTTVRNLEVSSSNLSDSALPSGYQEVLADVAKMIAESRRRAAATVNRELVSLYWQIGSVIVEQQETAAWGDAVVETLARDLRLAFPDIKGLSRANVFQMRQLVLCCHEIELWLLRHPDSPASSGQSIAVPEQKAATASGLFRSTLRTDRRIVQTASGQFPSPVSSDLGQLIPNLSWSHHSNILSRCSLPAERYFYMQMSIRERWSVRELRRQIDSALFTRYMSVRDEPEKCLPENAESGDLLPFKDHYILEFLGLEDEHSERDLRHAILANLRDFFLEFGRDLAFVGEEYPLTVGSDTFHIDLLFFHRRLQCLIAVELKVGKFKPEYAGKSQFYCAALDELVRLPHETPSIGLVLCRSADRVQMRLALTAAAEQVGVATYQTALPDQQLIEQRVAQLARLQEVAHDD